MDELLDPALELIRREKAVFYSDIARELKVSNNTARDIVKCLIRAGHVKVINKGVARLVILIEGAP